MDKVYEVTMIDRTNVSADEAYADPIYVVANDLEHAVRKLVAVDNNVNDLVSITKLGLVHH